MFHLEHIRSATLRMKVSSFKDGLHLRLNTDLNPLADQLIGMETISREKAYRNTRIRTSSTFYDDSDMKSEYYLVLVYDAQKNSPLLTARYYYDADTIYKSLKGDNYHHSTMDLSPDFFQRPIFLADRLSANVTNTMYRQFRTYIFTMFYTEIFKHTQNSSFIIMARKEKGDKLLRKYLALGTEIIGTVMHKGLEHWVLSGEVNRSYTLVKSLTEKQTRLLT